MFFLGLIEVGILLIAVANLLWWLLWLGEIEGESEVYTCAVGFVGKSVGYDILFWGIKLDYVENAVVCYE